ncbi:TetR/AcrR family transcriptional regulator [Actinoplanes sp. NPDC000266]
MPSTTRRPSAGPDRRAAVQAQIVAATERLLAGGATFTELGVQRIAAEAGVARSTFYLHFRDKSELALSLAGSLAGAAYAIMQAWDPGAPDALESFERTMADVIRFYRARPAALAAVLEVTAYDEAVREAWAGQLDQFAGLATRLLTAEQEAGRTTADLEPSAAGRLMIYGGMQAIAHQVASGAPEEDGAVARELARLQWYGTFRRPA